MNRPVQLINPTPEREHPLQLGKDELFGYGIDVEPSGDAVPCDENGNVILETFNVLGTNVKSALDQAKRVGLDLSRMVSVYPIATPERVPMKVKVPCFGTPGKEIFAFAILHFVGYGSTLDLRTEFVLASDCRLAMREAMANRGITEDSIYTAQVVTNKSGPMKVFSPVLVPQVEVN